VKRAALRWARRLLVSAACAGLLAALVHTPWARGLVLRQVTAALSARSSFAYSADALDYNLFGLTVGIEGLRISRRGSDAAPLLYVKRAEAAFSRRVFAGLVELDRLDADGVAVVIDLGERGGRPEDDRPFRVPSFTIGKARLRHAAIEVIDPDGLGHLRVRGVALDAAGGGPRRLTASFVVEGGLALDSDDARVRVDRVDGRASLDGDTIGVMPSSASAGSRRLALDGKVTFTGPSPAFDLGIAGAADIALITSWFPALLPGNGLLELTGRAEGPLNDPQFTFAARSGGITLPGIKVPAAAAEGRISRAGMYIDRLRASVGNGRVDVSGRLPLGPDDRTSRVSLTWADVPVGGLARMFDGLPEGPIGVVLSGSARLRWPGTALRFDTLEGDVESDVRFAPSLPPARASLTASPGRWALRATQDFDGGTIASLEAAIAVDSDDVAKSRIAGALRASSADLRPDLDAIRRGFPGLPDISAWLSEGQISVDSVIDGTLGVPRLTGMARSERMRLGSLPRMKAGAAFEITPSRVALSEVAAHDGAGNRVDGRAAIDVDAGATEGAFTAKVTNPGPILVTLLRTGQGSVDETLKASGLLTLSGSWNGPLDDPVLAMTLGAEGVSATTASFSVERTAIEGRLDGPLSNPEATLRISAGAVRGGSLAPVPADAQLSLASGRFDVRASVPDWSATLDGHIAAEAPHAFTAALSVADLSAARLAALLGEDASDWAAGGSISVTLDADGHLDDRRLRIGGRADLAAGSLRAGESRLVDGMNASVEVRDGRLWLTRAAGLGFAGPLGASGDLPLNWVEAYLPAGWRLSDVPPAPRAAAFDVRAEPDVKTLGTWLRPDEPGRITGALRLRATGTASAPSLAALDGRVIVEPDVVRARDVAFALPSAAEIRIKDGRAAAEHVTITAPGTTMSIAGTVALEGERAIDVRLTASGALGFLSSVVPGRVAGNFTADLRAAGAAADPQVTGKLSLDGAAWVWPEQRIAFRDWSGQATIDQESVTVGALDGHLNGGDASVSGEVRFEGGGRGLTLRVRDAFAEVIKGLRSQADADLTLVSSGDGARLSGKVTVTSGAYREPITAMARLFAAAPEGAAKADLQPSRLDAVALDVELTAAAPIIIENSAGRLDLVPSMKLQGTLAEPALSGTLDMVDEGRLSLLGRTFRLSEASVVFAGTSDPAVQIIGETRVGNYAVTLRTAGPVSRLEPTFTSEPPLSQRDLQSLLVTGRTTDISGMKGSDDQEFALGAASSDLLGFAGQVVGLESVQLGRADFELGASDVDPAMRLTVSKRVTDRARLVLSQDLDNNKFTWIAIYAPKRSYEIRVSQRDNVEEAVEFRQELLFGPGVSPPTAPGRRSRAKGPRVSSVGFSGDLLFPVSELESVLTLKKGKPFDAGRWQEDRARLEAFYRRRGYATARIVPGRTIANDGGTDRAALIYRVDPGPRTILQVNGIDLSDGDRRDLMRVWSGSVLPEFLDDDISAHLRTLLAERGYLRPSIVINVTTPAPDAVLADVAVTPGPVAGTRTLVIEGAREVAEPELREALSGSAALEAAWVDPAPLVEAVAALYAQRGFAEARVTAEPLAFEGGSAERRLRVTEGPRSVVASVTITGAAEARAAEARTAVGLEPGQPLLPGMEADAKRRLERFYVDRGYRSASVRAGAAREPDGRVNLAFAVTEGPLSIVSAVQVTGLEATKPSVVNGTIALRPGQPAGQDAATDAQAHLYGLGVFRKADVAFEPAQEAPGTEASSLPVVMKVSLEESRRYQLRYGVQLSNQYGPVFEDFTSAIGVAADISDRNFLGRAFTLGASGRLEKNLQSSRAQFSLPPAFNQRLYTSVFGTFRSETDTTEESVTYTDNERDVTFEQRLRLPRRMDLSWGYSYNVRDVSLTVERLSQSIELKNVLGYLTGTFVIDRRDSPFNASRGWFQSSNVQWGLEELGADIDYFRVLLRQFYYRPVGPLVFASGVRWGWLHGLEGVPDREALGLVDQLFDAGGGQTVRGYAEDSLSAYEVFGAPVGGSKLLLLNQEIRFPLFSRWLQGAAFIDAGNTFKPGTSIRLDELAVGAGFGIRIMTPFAPLRLDIGYPLDRRPEDRPYRLYFSIGQIF
jgi:outer membrane protein assembly factor BamA/autotransporter translocation and assembly factor TamB